jgi:DNA-binding response OmpR family regulator
MHLLLIEDDALLGEGLLDGLSEAGFVVDWVTDGVLADTALSMQHSFDIAVLDLGLPRMDGVQVLRALRARNEQMPVLVLTARDAVEERVRLLNMGADDYLIKPFVLSELVARLYVLLRRVSGRFGLSVLHWRDIELHPMAKVVTKNHASLDLTASEFQLLHILMANAPSYLSRQTLEEKMRGWQDEVQSNSLDVHLSNLRRKIGKDAIENVRGLGWRMGQA